MTDQKKDYYGVLGVSQGDGPDEIKKRFRELAQGCHPDKVSKGDKAVATEKFKQINEAYQVLSDPDRRKKYDASYHTEERVGTESGQTDRGAFGLSGIDNMSSFVFGLSATQAGRDKKGWFFAIPKEDIKLLAALYGLRREAEVGKRGITYDTGVYRVELTDVGDVDVKVRPGHWRSEPGEIRTSKYGEYKIVDPNVPTDPESIGYNWKGVERPPQFRYYLAALVGLSQKLTMEGRVDCQREHKTICDYGFDSRILGRFDTRRLGFDEVHDTVAKYSSRLRDIGGAEIGGEKTRR